MTLDSLLSLLSFLVYKTGMYWTRNKPFRVVVQTDELTRVRQLDSSSCMAGAPGSGPLLGALPPLLPSAFTHMLVSWLHLLVSHPVPASQASLLCLELPLQGVCTLPHIATCSPLTSLTALFKCVLRAPVCGGDLCPWQSRLPSCSLRSLSVSSSWNRDVLSRDILALSLLECQLHESEHFVPSTKRSTQHTVGVLSRSVMSSSLRPHGL